MPSVAMNPVFEELASSYSDVLFLTVDVDDDDVKYLYRIEMEDLKKNIIHEIKNRIEDMVRNEVNKLSGELTERQGAAAPMSRKKMLDIIAGAEKISAAQKTMLDAIAAQEKKLGAAHEQKILEIGAAHEKMLRASQAKMLNMLVTIEKKIDLFGAHEKKILDISDELEKQMSEIRAERETARAQFAEIIKR
ncbi:hypothetical protein QYF36_011026 [Acer negundo]|nr:hypothetical protein QYF36_011026 [Acer negundo]